MTQTSTAPVHPLPRPLPSQQQTLPDRARATARFTPTTVRIGDAERSQACDELAAHYAAGRLDREELEERMELAVGARTQYDLMGLVGDLPPLSAPRTPNVAPATAMPVGSTDPIRALWLGAVGFVTISAMLCTGLLLLVSAASREGFLIWLSAFGAFVSAAGATYLLMLRRR